MKIQVKALAAVACVTAAVSPFVPIGANAAPGPSGPVERALEKVKEFISNHGGRLPQPTPITPKCTGARLEVTDITTQSSSGPCTKTGSYKGNIDNLCNCDPNQTGNTSATQKCYQPLYLAKLVPPTTVPVYQCVVPATSKTK